MGAQHVTLDELAAESDLLFVWVEDPSFVSLHLCLTVEKCSLLYVPVCRCGCVSAFVAFCVVLPPSWCCLLVSCCVFNVHLILKRLDRRCASLNPTTEGILSRSLLSKMRPTTCIINTSRGGLVDQEALVEALEVSILDSENTLCPAGRKNWRSRSWCDDSGAPEQGSSTCALSERCAHSTHWQVCETVWMIECPPIHFPFLREWQLLLAAQQQPREPEWQILLLKISSPDSKESSYLSQ